MDNLPNRPEQDGISFVVPDEAQGWRLDKALGLILSAPTPEQEAARPDLFSLADLGLRARRRLCDRSLVLVNDRPAIPGLRVRAGQKIRILSDPEGSQTTPADADAPGVVTRDGGLVALYKPAGLHTASLAGSLAKSLEALLGILLPGEDAHLLNRLDAPTSGLVLAACDEESDLRWHRAERIGQADKLYLAVVEGRPAFDFTVPRRLDTDGRTKTRVRSSDDPDPVRHTDVTLLSPLTAGELPAFGGYPSDAPLMLIGCRIRKGARHQIRAHLAAAGHPLAGDALYGAQSDCGFLLHHGRVTLPGFAATCLPAWLAGLPEDVRNTATTFLSR